MQLTRGLGVAVEVDAAPGQSRRAAPARARRPRRRRTPGPPRPARGRRPCRETPWRRTARRSRRGATPSASSERPSAPAEVVLGDDVGRRAELARQLDRVAAADLEAAALVDPRAERDRRARCVVVVRLTGRDHAMRPKAWDHRARAPPADGEADACRPRSATHDGSRLLAVAPRRPLGPRRDRDPARRRVVQGEPLRLRPRRAAARTRRDRPSTSAGTARARGRWTARASTTSPRWPRCSARRSATQRPRSRCAARAWAAIWRSSRPGDAEAAAVVAICPASAQGLRRGLAERRLDFDADVAALDALLGGARPARHRRGARPSRCCCCTPRATSRFRSSISRELAAASDPRRQPPDRRARRPPPLDPARRRAAGGEPALHHARAEPVAINARAGRRSSSRRPRQCAQRRRSPPVVAWAAVLPGGADDTAQPRAHLPHAAGDAARDRADGRPDRGAGPGHGAAQRAGGLRHRGADAAAGRGTAAGGRRTGTGRAGPRRRRAGRRRAGRRRARRSRTWCGRV